MEHLARIERIILHHTQHEYDFPEYVKMRHKRQGREDIGYHYLIGNGRMTVDGHLYAGRDGQYQGRNTLDIGLIGDFDDVAPSMKQMLTLYRFLDEKMKEYDVAVSSILGHRELGSIDSCPGRNVHMDEIRKNLCLKTFR